MLKPGSTAREMHSGHLATTEVLIWAGSLGILQTEEDIPPPPLRLMEKSVPVNCRICCWTISFDVLHEMSTTTCYLDPLSGIRRVRLPNWLF